MGFSDGFSSGRWREPAFAVLRDHAVVCVVRQMGNGVDRVESARLVFRPGDSGASACAVDLAGDARMLDCVAAALSSLGLVAVLAWGVVQCAARPHGVGCVELTTVML